MVNEVMNIVKVKQTKGVTRVDSKLNLVNENYKPIQPRLYYGDSRASLASSPSIKSIITHSNSQQKFIEIAQLRKSPVGEERIPVI